MVNQNLVRYIQNALNSGVDLNFVRAQLLQQGYSQYEVDESINFLLNTPREIHHTIKLSKSVVISIAAIILGIVITSYVVIQLTENKTPSRLLDFETLPLKTMVKAGEVLSFQVRLFNMGSALRYDITINSSVISQDNKIVAKKVDTFAVEKRTTETMQIEIPSSLKPGTYSVRSKATYSKGEALSSFEFRVYKESSTPTCSDSIQNQGEKGVDCGGPCKKDCCFNSYQDSELGEEGIDCGGVCKPCKGGCENCDDNNACTEDSCENNKCIYKTITPCCGNNVCEQTENFEQCPSDCQAAPQQDVNEIIEKAKATSKVNLNSAVELCTSLREARDKDRCLEIVSEASNQSSVCSNIQSVSKRDACYMNFAMPPNDDYSVCERVENEYLKKSCESLKYINTVEKR